MPGLAHAVVQNALSYGQTTLEWSKSKEGTIKWAVETVERPVQYTLGSRLAQTFLKVGDKCLTIADNTIDGALQTKTFKTCENVVKSAYSNKVEPAIKNTTTCVCTTTTMVTSPVCKAYVATLNILDRQIEFFLPPVGDEPEKSVTAIALTSKVARRSGRRAVLVKDWTVTKVSNAKNTVVYTIEQAHPTNVKKNVAYIYTATLHTADSFVDQYLPDTEDGLVVKGPVTLVTKVVRRAAKRTVSGVKAAGLAVRNSPATFKAVARSTAASTRALVGRARALAAAAATYDYVGSARAQTTAVVVAADRALQRHRATLVLRDFVLARYSALVAPILARFGLIASRPPPQPQEQKQLTDGPAEKAPAPAPAAAASAAAAAAAPSAPAPAPAASAQQQTPPRPARAIATPDKSAQAPAAESDDKTPEPEVVEF